jgi:PspAA-like protein
MIIRILTEGQFDVSDSDVEQLNVLDERLEAAIDSGDEEAFSSALAALLAQVRAVGSAVADDALVPSDLLLPYSDASLAEVRDLLRDDGLIPGRSAGSAPADA